MFAVRRPRKAPSPKSKDRSYKGWTLKPVTATQVGHKLPDSRSVMSQIGAGTHRKVTGYDLYTPEGERVKFCDTLKQAKEYIENYGEF